MHHEEFDVSIASHHKFRAHEFNKRNGTLFTKMRLVKKKKENRYFHLVMAGYRDAQILPLF